MTNNKVWWYRRFRTATYANVLVWVGWTVAILLPFPPFSYLQPIIAGGGAGTWFLLGYILFPVTAVAGFASISTLAFVIETHEARELNYPTIVIGFGLLYIGVLAGCLLLGLAGATGGFAIIFQRSTVDVTQNVLSPYVYPITAASLVAVVGVAVTVYGMATAKAT